MNNFSTHCFVCGKATDPLQQQTNKQLNLPVCQDCAGTEQEEKAAADLLDGMADGFVCGCI